ncbi:MAG: hypothetical protein H7256_15080 [Bdellovibrio sp.]|nr:hypothetical protein [Bdellovibrio sp.]
MRFLFGTAFALILSCTPAPVHKNQGEAKAALIVSSIPTLQVEKLIVTPDADGHRDFITAILTAKKSVYLKMFHLTNDDVVEALIQAHKNGVEVKVILDSKSMLLSRFSDPYKKLLKHQVPVLKSTSKFSITHEKSMTVDHSVALVTAINLTKNYKTTRDFGIVTKDAAVVSEVESVFQADWQNAIQKKGITPNLTNPFLIWSPINSREKIVALVGYAKKSIDLEVENFGDADIQDALVLAAKKGIQVRVIVPLCDKNFNPFHNVKYIQQMEKDKVQVRVMPAPETEKTPYMHSKMILVDGQAMYIGSVNFSNNSTQKARELGLIFSNDKVAKQISTIYNQDWDAAIPLPENRSRIQCIKYMKGVL